MLLLEYCCILLKYFNQLWKKIRVQNSYCNFSITYILPRKLPVLKRKMFFFYSYRKTITSVAFSGDGKYLATGEVSYSTLMLLLVFIRDFTNIDHYVQN